MAVEVDVELRKPIEAEDFVVEIGNTLRQWLGLHSSPSVRWCAQPDPNNKDYPEMRLWVGDCAEVSLMPYTVYQDLAVKACISFAPLRTAESKVLCLAAAIALAKAGAVCIEDDAKLFGGEDVIDPNHALDGLDARKAECAFGPRAREACLLIQARVVRE